MNKEIFKFTTDERIRLALHFKQQPEEKVNNFIDRTEANINDFIFVEQQDYLSVKETKIRLDSISKAASTLHKELSKKSSKLIKNPQ